MTSPHMAGGSDRIEVAVHAPVHELSVVQTDFMVRRWDAEQTAWALDRMRHRLADSQLRWVPEPTAEVFDHYGVRPYSETLDENCNNVLSAGWALLLAVAGRSAIIFSSTIGRIGIGDSSTAVSFTQTDLQASTNKTYVLCGVAPTIQTATSPASWVFTASFGSSNANYAWQEFITDQGTATNTGPVVATCLNRGVSAQGTKASGQTWSVTETLSFGFPSGSGTVS